MALCSHSLTCAVNPTENALIYCPSALAVLYNRHITDINKIRILSRRPELLPLRVYEDVLLCCLEHTADIMSDLFEEKSAKAIKSVVHATDNLLWHRRMREKDTDREWTRSDYQADDGELRYRDAINHVQTLYDSEHSQYAHTICKSVVGVNSPQITNSLWRVSQELRCYVLRFFGVTYVFGLAREKESPLAILRHKKSTFEETVFKMADLFGMRNKLNTYMTFGDSVEEAIVGRAVSAALELEIQWTVNKIKEVFMRATRTNT